MTTGKPRRILVVDDDKMLRTFYCRVLSSHGYTPICASNGQEAIDILEADPEPYDLAVIDVLLPVKSGWELIEHIRESQRHRELPILAVSGLSFSYDQFERIKELCDCVLLKGEFELSRFSEAVAALLEDGAPAT